MEPPSKRLKLGPSSLADDGDEEENQDELSMTPAQFDSTQDPMYKFDKRHIKAAKRYKSNLEDIFAKYGKDFDGDDDIVNFYTERFEVDNGHIESLEDVEDILCPSDEGEKSVPDRKSGNKKKRPLFKSLTLSNHASRNQGLHLNSPWNRHTGLNTHRLSSLTFTPSSYGSPPPFNFGPNMFGNGHIDPVWQTPDLPTDAPYHQHGSFVGIGGSPSSSFGGPSSHVPKRLVSAKSFLLRAASTDGGETDEEDDILLGRNNQDEVHCPDSKGLAKALVAATPEAGLHRLSQTPDQQPSFNGNILVEGEPHTKLAKATVQTITTESSMTKVVSPLPQLPNADPQHSQKARSSQSPSPSRRKRGRPKKSDSRESTNTPDEEELSPENHVRQPNIKRIEIIIPIMKRLLPTDIEATEGTDLVANETLQSPGKDQTASISKGIEVTLLEDDSHTSQSTSSHADELHYPSTDIIKDLQVVCAAQIADDPNHGTSPSNTEELRRGRLRRTREHPDLSNMNTLPHDEKARENMFIDVSQELESSQTTAESFTDDNRVDSSYHTGQKSDGDSESDGIPPSQRASPDSEVGMEEEQVVSNTSVEGNMEAMQVKKKSPEGIPTQSVSLTRIPCDGAADGITEMPDFPTTEAMVTELSEFQKEFQGSHHEIEDLLQNELDALLVGIDGEEFPAHSPASDGAAAQEAAVGSSEVADAYEAQTSVPGRDIGYESPEHSVIRESTESDMWQGQGFLFPTPEAPETREDQEHNLPDESLFDSAHSVGIDSLQLYSDYQYAQRSPSLGAMELPNPDLSDVPVLPDAHTLTESVLRLLSHSTESDSQRTSGEGMSPSPELGTPIGPKTARETASQAKDSLVPITPTRKQSSKSAKSRTSHRRSPSSKRFPLTSLIPGGIDDDSDDELSIAGSFSGASSRLHSPFFRPNNNSNPDLPPLLPTPRKKTRKHRLLTRSPPSSTRTPNRIFGIEGGRNMPPATESRVGRSQARRGRNRAVHSSPLARRVAERLLSSPIKKHHGTPLRSPSVVASPNGTLRRCGENGFVCDRDFCLTCCI